MTTQTCPHCGAYVAGGRTICKACGRDINKPLGSPAEAVEPVKAGAPFPVIPVVIGVIVVTIVLSWLASSQGLLVTRAPVPARLYANDPIAAYVACKEFVGNQLKAPTQAQWPTANDATMTSMGDGKWRVVSYVDAPNALGVMLRNNYTCELTLTPGRWTGNRLVFGGEEIYP